MNCNEYQKKAEAYVSGSLPEAEKKLITAHLGDCNDCKNVFLAVTIIEKMVTNETRQLVNPFMKTRVMAQINSLPQTQPVTVFQLARNWNLNTLLVAASIIVSVFLGITAGNFISKSKIQNQIPEELVFLNDASLESLPVFMND